jgi:chitodextrinase
MSPGHADVETGRSRVGGLRCVRNADQVYLEGSEVLHNGLVHKAKWWTQADTPSTDPQHLGNAPW